MSDPKVQFSDNDKTRAQESPSSNQGESPRATGSENDLNDYNTWLEERRKSTQTVTQDKPEETPAYSPSAPSGRRVAPTEPSKSEARIPETPEEETERAYVWLSNGEVLLADVDDLPSHAGKGSENGYWEKDGKVYPIVAVHPVETTIKEK